MNSLGIDIKNSFEMAIGMMLQQRAREDELFAPKLKKENKSIHECALYIYGELEQTAKENRNGNTAVVCLSDDDVMNLAVHYFEEDCIVVKKPTAKVETKAPSMPKTAAKADSKASAKAQASKATNTKAKTAELPNTASLTKAQIRKGEDCGSLFDF